MVEDSEGIYQVEVYFQKPLDEEGCAIEIRIVTGYILHAEVNGYFRIYKVSEDRDIPFLLAKRVCFETELEYATTGVVIKVVSFSSSLGVRQPSDRERNGFLFDTMSDDTDFKKENVNTLDLYRLVRRKFRTGMDLPESGSISSLLQTLQFEIMKEIPGLPVRDMLDESSDRIKFRKLCLELLKFK